MTRPEAEGYIYAWANEKGSRSLIDCGSLGFALLRWMGMAWDVRWVDIEDYVTIDEVRGAVRT